MTAKKASGRKGPPTERFPFDREYDFSYHPETYWPDLPTERTVLSTIEGTARRDIARRAVEGEELPRLGDDELYREAMEFVLEEKLEDDDRDRWGAIHPAMMGGEYLPAREEGEVEIARFELASTTGDVRQVRARRTAEGIGYRAVDEYWDDESHWVVTPEVSKSPLTLGELIELIDTARQTGSTYGEDRYDVGLVDGVRNAAYDEGGEAEDYAYFVSASSAFYPQLSEYYDQRAAAWFEAVKAEAAEDEEDDDAPPYRWPSRR